MLLIKELLQRNVVLSLQMLVKNMPVRYIMLSINIVIICVTQIQNNMFMTPTDPNEIGKYIDTLKNKNSSGHDEMTSTFLKSVRSAVVQPLSILINKSLETGIVPDKLKLAKVIPIYKSKDKELLNNYRPISLLPTIYKIMEKLVHKRLYNFMHSQSVLYPGQYGFRTEHSTTHAVTEFENDTIEGFENK